MARTKAVLQRWPGQPDALHFLGVLEHTRGHSEAALARVTCPIGIPGIEGKAPEVIAASVAAQLLLVESGAPAGSPMPA